MHIPIRKVVALSAVAVCAGAVFFVSPRAAESRSSADTSPAEVRSAVVRGMVAGGTDVASSAKLDRVADILSSTFGRSPASMAAGLQRLKAKPGAGLYLEVQQSQGQAARPRLVLEPVQGTKPALLVNGQIELDLPGRAAALDSALAVFWVQGGTQQEYRARVPASITHVTVVVNGRTIAAARPFIHARGEVVIR